MDIIKTTEQLSAMVSGEDALITTRPIEVRGQIVQEVIVVNGELNLEDAEVMGLAIRFENCKMRGSVWTHFLNCTLHFLDCTIQSMEVVYSTVDLKGCFVVDMSVRGEKLVLGEGNKVTSSIIQPSVLSGAGEQVLALHKEETNALGSRVNILRTTASVTNFGTYMGSAHYFAESDMVIAGCWQGKLEEFKEKAQEREVNKDSYEAVYNYFKSFNQEELS